MAKDGFTLFSSANISCDEYMSWLHQLNAVITPDKPYDARLSKDTRHVWVRFHDKRRLDIDLMEMEEEHLTEIRHILGDLPRSAVGLVANGVCGSQILGVQFAACCAERYPCLVYQYAGDIIFPAHKVLALRDAGKGFDGYTWETADPARSFSWLDSWLREKFGDSFEAQMLAGSDTLEGRDRKQPGA
jgi:hypothetical protein